MARKDLVAKNGKVVAYVEKGIMHKYVDGSKHKLLTPEAWAMDETVYLQAKNAGAKEIQIHDRHDNNTYRIEMTKFNQYREFLSRGFGVQVYVEMKRWTRIPPSGPEAEQRQMF